MKKHLFALLIALLGVCLEGSAVSFSVGDFQYNTSGSEARVAGLSASAKSSGVTIIRIPAYVTYNGTTYPVTGIYDTLDHGAFETNTTITTVYLGTNIKTITYRSFYGCTNLTKVYMYSDIEEIGTDAFYGCSKLTSFYTMQTEPRAAGTAFSYINSKATLYVLNAPNYTPSDFKKNGYTSFKNVSTWDAMNVGDLYFRVKAGPKNASTPGEVELIRIGGTSAKTNLYYFWYTAQFNGAGVTDKYDYYRLTSIAPMAAHGNTGLTTVNLSSSSYLTEIGNMAFANCTALTSITLNEGLKILNSSVFSYTAITTLNLPKSLTTFYGSTFNDLFKLEKFTVTSGSSNFSADANGVLYNASQTILLKYPPGRNSAAPAILSSVTRLFNSAYYQQQYIQYVEVPPTVTTIDSWVFGQMPKLTWVQIPSTATLAGDASGLFYNDTQLSRILLNKNTPPTVSSNTFTNVPSSCILVVPVGYRNNYLGDSDYSRFKNYLWTGSYDFRLNNVCYSIYNTNSKTYNGTTYDASVRVVKCYNPGFLVTAKVATTNNVSSSVTDLTFTNPSTGGKKYYCDEVGDSAYYGNPYIKTITDNNADMGWIRTSAFQGCTALTTVKLPRMRNYYSRSFQGCTALTSVDFSNQTQLYTLNTAAFLNCTALTQANLYNTKLSAIGDNAFEGCTKLTGVTFPTGQYLRTIGTSAFSRSGIISAILPYGVTTIKNHAFSMCPSLTTVLVPSSVTEISQYFLSSSPKMEKLYLNLKTNPWSSTNFGTTLNSNLKIYVPARCKTNYSALSTLSSYMVDGGSYDFYAQRGSGDNYYYTVTTPTTDVNTHGKVKLVKSPSNSTLLAANMVIHDEIPLYGYTYDVTEIDADALSDFTGLRTCKFGDNITVIGPGAFKNSMVNYVGPQADQKKSVLNTVTTIGAEAFYNSNLWGSMDISSTIGSIGDNAFDVKNSSFQELIFRRWLSAPSLGSNVWTSQTQNLKVLIDYRAYDYYKAKVTGWTSGGDRLLNPYITPTYEYKGVAVNCDLNLVQSGLDSNIECYYVNYYDRTKEQAITQRIDGTVKAATGFIVKAKEVVKGSDAGQVGSPYYILPRYNGTGVTLPNNLLVGVPSSDYTNITVPSGTNFYTLNSDGTFNKVSSSSLSLYANAYLSLPTSIAGSTEKIKLDIAVSSLPGDVNGDGVVNSNDIAAVVNVIAGIDPASKYEGRADVDGNGVVNANDIAEVVNIIAGM